MQLKAGDRSVTNGYALKIGHLAAHNDLHGIVITTLLSQDKTIKSKPLMRHIGIYAYRAGFH